MLVILAVSEPVTFLVIIVVYNQGTEVLTHTGP